MGRVKLEIKKHTNKMMTYSKRRNGLIKKAYELLELCDIDLAVVMFSPSGKLTVFSKDGRLESRYTNAPLHEKAKGKSENVDFVNKLVQKLRDERGGSSSVPQPGCTEVVTQVSAQIGYDLGVLPAPEGPSNEVTEVQTVDDCTHDNSLGEMRLDSPLMLTDSTHLPFGNSLGEMRLDSPPMLIGSELAGASTHDCGNDHSTEMLFKGEYMCEQKEFDW